MFYQQTDNSHINKGSKLVKNIIRHIKQCLVLK